MILPHLTVNTQVLCFAHARTGKRSWQDHPEEVPASQCSDQRPEQVPVFCPPRSFCSSQHAAPKGGDAQHHCLAGMGTRAGRGHGRFAPCCVNDAHIGCLAVPTADDSFLQDSALSPPMFSVLDMQLFFSFWIHGFDPFVKP